VPGGGCSHVAAGCAAEEISEMGAHMGCCVVEGDVRILVSGASFVHSCGRS
jgi:hypothetical protein